MMPPLPLPGAVPEDTSAGARRQRAAAVRMTGEDGSAPAATAMAVLLGGSDGRRLPVICVR